METTLKTCALVVVVSSLINYAIIPTIGNYRNGNQRGGKSKVRPRFLYLHLPSRFCSLSGMQRHPTASSHPENEHLSLSYKQVVIITEKIDTHWSSSWRCERRCLPLQILEQVYNIFGP